VAAETTNQTRPHVVLIEDDPSIVVGLRMNLENEGYQVSIADEGEAGLALARQPGVDLIILDVMLPTVNGFEILRLLRREGRTMPIIVLSARSSEIDKVMGLELGAEDYVAKPFGLAELLARVRAALRRAAMVSRPKETHRFGDIEIDEGTREVRRNGAHVELTATEFDVVLALLEARGRVLSREQILEKIYGPGHHGTARTIDNFLMQLRNKLEDEPQAPKHLVTVRGVGYRLVP
jgi:two-component system, OmpR family, alkaline phosphatase synthesis response regulator PhoP